jgi:hypothetical protein
LLKFIKGKANKRSTCVLFHKRKKCGSLVQGMSLARGGLLSMRHIIFLNYVYSSGMAVIAIGGEQVLLSLKIKDGLACFTKEHILLLETNYLFDEFI